MRFYRVFTITFFLFISTTAIVLAEEGNNLIKEQEDSLGINTFFEESSEYTSGVFDDIDMHEILEQAIKGKVDNGKVLKSIFRIFGNELQDAITVLGSIILIIIVNSILNCITEGLENKSVSKVAYYIQFILIVTVALGNFSEIINMAKNSINNMVGFINLLLPIMMTLIITTGSVTTASIMQPVIVFMTSLVANFINNVAIPILLISTTLGLISKISGRSQVDRLSKRLKSSTIWIIGIILTLFVTVVSIDGSLSGSVDAVTSKTTKAAVSNLVPVVGKILGDAVDSVIGCSNILKNAIGVVGVIIVIAIAISPIIKLLLLMFVYYATSAICEPIADEKIIKILDQMGDTFKTLLAFMCSMFVMLVIGITLTMKISGAGYIN